MNFNYLHTVVKDNLSKLAVIVSVNTKQNDDKVKAFGKQLAMHIAASNPLALTSEDIDRSYGNSPYFFYNHYPEEDKKEVEEHSTLRSKIYREENLPEYPSA